jgi:hypothetical protein
MFLEETTGPTLLIDINGSNFNIPMSWNILIVDDYTKSIDSVPIYEAATKFCDVYLFTSLNTKYFTSKIKIISYLESEQCVHPLINKGEMMLHPCGTDPNNQDNVLSAAIGPHDIYKYISDISAKDLIYY